MCSLLLEYRKKVGVLQLIFGFKGFRSFTGFRFQVSGVRNGLRIAEDLGKLHGALGIGLNNLMCKFGHDSYMPCAMLYAICLEPETSDQKLTPDS